MAHVDDQARDDHAISFDFSENSTFAIRASRSLGLDASMEWSPSRILFDIEEFVSMVLASFQPAFDFSFRKSGKRRRKGRPTAIGKCLANIDRYLSVFDRSHVYAEQQEIFFRACSYSGFIPVGGKPDAQHVTDLKDPEVQQRLNQVVSAIRALSGRASYYNAAYCRHRRSFQNREQLAEFVRCVMGRWRRVVVVRVDLTYTRDGLSDLSLEKFREDFYRFRTHVGYAAPFKDMHAYAWALEQSVEKGFHVHAAFFFDGNRVWKDKFRAMEIGKYWQSHITDGRGLYFNCNAKQDEYRNRGVGVFRCCTERDVENIVNALSYLTKANGQHLRMRRPGMHAFGASQVPVQRGSVPAIMPVG